MNKNKIALVTGGSRGLGKNMALSIAQKGLDVIITYNSKQDEANEVVKQIEAIGQKALALQLNIADSKTFDGFVATLKNELQNKWSSTTIDYLVNNAGIGMHNTFSETPEDVFDNMVNIHFKGAFFITQKLIDIMPTGSGIVNISTGLTRFAFPGYGAYAAAKGAMEVITKYQAKELGAKGIRSNIVAPGAIETDFGGGAVRDNKDLNTNIASITALGRVGLPDDIGGVVAFLCTDDAKWVNAQRIEVSGGMML
jgi:NAD(P)-dependent dehydrogenase (short-subunit alcohol dehydrogenase family)